MVSALAAIDYLTLCTHRFSNMAGLDFQFVEPYHPFFASIIYQIALF